MPSHYIALQGRELHNKEGGGEVRTRSGSRRGACRGVKSKHHPNMQQLTKVELCLFAFYSRPYWLF